MGLALAQGALAGSAVHPTRLSVDRYGLDEGLSQLSVTAIAQDDSGFLWIGTQEGLNRFDGQRFLVLRESGGLPSNSIESLAFDASSRLWVGTNDAGLHIRDLRNGGQTNVGLAQGLGHPTVTGILLDGQRGAWLTTPAGVDYLDANGQGLRVLSRTLRAVGLAHLGEGEALLLDAECALWRAGPGHVERVAAAIEGMDGCTAMVASADGYWVADEGGVVARMLPDGSLARRMSLPAEVPGALGVSAMHVQAGRFVWLGRADGSLWQLPLDGVGEGAPRRVRLDQDAGGPIQRVFVSEDGVLWLGSLTRGLFRARPLSDAVGQGRVEAGAPADWPSRSLRAIHFSGEFDLVGTDAGLVWRRGDADWRTVATIGATSVRSIAPAARGGWWIGSHRGVWHLAPDGRAQPMAELADPRVTDLLAERDAAGADVLWVATRGGLARFVDGVRVPHGWEETLDGQFLTSLMRDDLGRLWIGSNESGLFRSDVNGELEHLSPATGGLPHQSVWSLHADDAAFWVGTFSGGLIRIDRVDGGMRRFGEAQGLSNEVVYRILPDDHGRLWLSTNNGISVLDPGRELVQTLGRGDGLHNREYNSGAGSRGPDGRLYFGGTEGLDVLAPDGLAATSPPARPVLASLQVIGVKRGRVAEGPSRRFDTLYADTVVLDHRDAVIALQMVAIDFTAPAAARLRYRIKGLHEDWVHPGGASAELVLSNLPAGDYPLEISAAGRDGRFGPTRTVLIDVPPAPWMHPAAKAVYVVLALLGLAWLGSRIGARERARRAQIDLLNRTVAERTRALEEANQMLRTSNRQLEEATRTDPLTQVSNRRDLQQWLAREADTVVRELATRGQGYIGLLFFMIDIDDFKRINDQFGHQVGDEVLVAFAARLRALGRERDVVVRWGGEEFLWLVRDLALADAVRLAERARQAVADAPFELASGQVLAVTCSVGFAPWPFWSRFPALGDWEQSVNLADRALYAAKAGGKNAWVGVLPGPALDRVGMQRLLTGSDPAELAPDSVQLVHSTPDAPHLPGS